MSYDGFFSTAFSPSDLFLVYKRRNMKPKNLFSALLLGTLLLVLTVTSVFADKPTDMDNNGNAIEFKDTGFDIWGYNYNAHLFSGGYCDAYKDAAWCQQWKEDYLIMKWNDAWLSNQDRDNDGKLDRHWGYPSYIGSGAWETNHQSGTYLVDGIEYKWIYFVKIVAKPTAAFVCADNGAVEIWGEFCIIEEVYNDTGSGNHGVQLLAPPAGLGAY